MAGLRKLSTETVCSLPLPTSLLAAWLRRTSTLADAGWLRARETQNESGAGGGGLAQNLCFRQACAQIS